MSNFKLCTSLECLLAQFRKERDFSVTKWLPKKIAMFNKYMRENHLSACVVAVSGGIDSAVTLALCHRAQQEPDSPIKRIVALAIPIESTTTIWKRALELDIYKGVELYTIDASDEFDSMRRATEVAMNIRGDRFGYAQLKSYLRTPIYYYVAQLISQSGTPAVVVGTGNYDEDMFLYYFAKAGDGVTDVTMLGDLHKSEVYTLGKELSIPKSIMEADPTADLWAGQTDEQELGFTYDWAELYSEYIKLPLEEQTKLRIQLDEDGKRQFDEWEKLLHEHRKKFKHKELFPVNLRVL